MNFLIPTIGICVCLIALLIFFYYRRQNDDSLVALREATELDSPHTFATESFRERDDDIGRIYRAYCRIHSDHKFAEQRLLDFVNTSNVWCWELDAEFRLHHILQGDHMAAIQADKAAQSPEVAVLLGRKPLEDISFDHETADFQELHYAMERHLPFRNLIIKLTGDERTDWMSVSGTPVYSISGTFDGFRGSLRWIEEPGAESSSAAEAFFKAAINNLDRHIIVVDQRDQICFAHSDLAARLDVPAELLRPGSNIADFLGFRMRRGDFGSGDPETLFQNLLTAQSCECPDGEQYKAGENRKVLQKRLALAGIGMLHLFEEIAEEENSGDPLLETVADGIAYWHADDTLDFWDDKFAQNIGQVGTVLKSGMRYVEFLNARVQMGDVTVFANQVAAWLQAQTGRRKAAKSTQEIRSGKQWFQMTDARLDDGRKVTVLTDITKAKAAPLPQEPTDTQPKLQPRPRQKPAPKPASGELGAARQEPTAKAGPDRQAAKRRRILVIDNDLFNRSATAAILARAGHHCDDVATPAEAIAALLRAPYDCVLTAARLSDATAHDVAVQIRTLSEKFARLPFISYAEPALTEAHIDSNNGVDMHLALPLQADQLMAALQQLLGTESAPKSSLAEADKLQTVASNALDAVIDSMSSVR